MLKLIKFLIISLFLNACIQTSKPIKIGINPWPGYELLVTAKYFNKYKKHNLNVEIIEYGSLSDVKTAFINGQIDIMASTLIEVVTARLYEDTPIEVLFATDYSNGPDIILSKTKNLKGKRVGCELDSLGVYILGRALEKEGLSLKDIELIPADQSSLLELFSKNKIDAGITYPPFSIKLKKTFKELETIFDSSDIPYQVVDVVSIRKDVLKKHPRIKQKMLAVWEEILDDFRKKPESIIPIMAKREKIPVEEFKDSLEGIVFLEAKDQKNVPFKTIYETINKVLMEIGQIKKKAKFDIIGQ